MIKQEFEDRFLELINILIGMKNVYIPYFQLPNGDIISISIHLGNGRIMCERGSLTVYRFLVHREDKDHLKILSEYVYKHHSDEQLKEILNNLKVETVNQI